MLRPNKHTNLNMSVLSLSAQILKLIKKERIIEYDALLAALCKKFDGEKKQIEVKHIFLPAINLLHLLGLLDYHVKTDSFEYIEQHAA